MATLAQPTRPFNKAKGQSVHSRSTLAHKKLRKQAFDLYQAYQQSEQSPQQHQAQQYLIEARKHIKQALQHSPEDSNSLNLLSRIELEMGQVQSAQQIIEQALQLQPTHGAYWYSAGHVALAKQELEQAQYAFEQAIRFAPNETRADISLAFTLAQMGKVEQAFQSYRQLAKTHNHDPHVRSQICQLANQLNTDKYDPELQQDLLHYLSWEDVEHSLLANLVSSFLVAKFQISLHGSKAQLKDIIHCPLFNCALKKALIKGELLEHLVMAVRHELLSHSTQASNIHRDHLEIAQAIACYSHKNEFLLPTTDAEANMVQALYKLVDQSLSEFGSRPMDVSGALILIAMYSSWSTLSQFQTLMAFKVNYWPKIALSIRDVYVNQAKMASHHFDALTSISSKHKIRHQYERFPYPQWHNIDYKRHTTYAHALRQEYPQLTLPKRFYAKKQNVLIAGCGTGKHAITVAKYFTGSQVTALDISKNSLAYGKSRAQQFALNNIQFYQGDLTRLGKLDKQFDVIECSGVLHHIPHYKKALSAMLQNLIPQGLLKLSLYSEISRQDICRFRQQHDQVHKGHEETLKRIRQSIWQDDTLNNKHTIVQSADFYSLSGVVDMLFNEYEKHYTCLSIAQLCKEFQLNWLGFCNLDMPTKNSFKAFHGEKADMTDLQQWHEYELAHPHTFAAMYQFYCQYQPKPKGL